MEILDLAEEHLPLYFLCLEDWSDEMKEAGDHKARWYARMKDQGLRVKLAADDAGTIAGMVQYVPIEQSFAEGEGLYFINCIWVHGYKQGRGNFQKQGMGAALLAAAEADARALGATGMAAWGLAIPVWMKASWYKKHGYVKADRMGAIQSLVWKPFSAEARPPRWVRPCWKPETRPDKVTVTAFLNGWCPAMNLVFERARRAAAEFGDRVEFWHVDTFDRETFMRFGIGDGLYIDQKEVWTGPPPSFEKLRGMIGKKVKQVSKKR